MSSLTIQGFKNNYSQIIDDLIDRGIPELKSDSTTTSYAVTQVAAECFITNNSSWISPQTLITNGVYLDAKITCKKTTSRERYLLSLKSEAEMERCIMEIMREESLQLSQTPVNEQDPEYQAILDFYTKDGDVGFDLKENESAADHLKRVKLKYPALFHTIFAESQKEHGAARSKFFVRSILDYYVTEIKETKNRALELKRLFKQILEDIFMGNQSSIEEAKRDHPLTEQITTEVKSLKLTVTIENGETQKISTCTFGE